MAGMHMAIKFSVGFTQHSTLAAEVIRQAGIVSRGESLRRSGLRCVSFDHPEFPNSNLDRSGTVPACRACSAAAAMLTNAGHAPAEPEVSADTSSGALGVRFCQRPPDAAAPYCLLPSLERWLDRWPQSAQSLQSAAGAFCDILTTVLRRLALPDGCLGTALSGLMNVTHRMVAMHAHLWHHLQVAPVLYPLHGVIASSIQRRHCDQSNEAKGFGSAAAVLQRIS